MASLQIRDIPEPLHRQLQLRARRHHRSLAQQALWDLEAMAGLDPLQRRQAALKRLRGFWEQQPAVVWPAPPEEMLRADRDR
jgi:plasmid stability protein